MDGIIQPERLSKLSRYLCLSLSIYIYMYMYIYVYIYRELVFLCNLYGPHKEIRKKCIQIHVYIYMLCR